MNKKKKSVFKKIPLFVYITGILLILGIGGALATTIINDRYIISPEQNLTTLYLSGSNRPLFSSESQNQYVNITVCSSGCNYTTIQEAVDSLPYFIKGAYRIYVGNGNYPEQVYIKDITSLKQSNPENVGLDIIGNKSSPQSVNISSLLITNVFGSRFIIEGFNIIGTNPSTYDNENAGIAIYDSQEVELRNISFSNGTNGILCYDSTCAHNAVDFGNQVLSGYGFRTKHGGTIITQEDAQPIKGHTIGSMFDGSSGFQFWESNKDEVSSNTSLITTYNSIIFDTDKKEIYGAYPFKPFNLDSGLVAFYGFDENGDTTVSSNVYDSTIYNNNAYMKNGTIYCSDSDCPTWRKGVYKSGVSFDGINDVIDLNKSLGLGNETFSISLWVNLSSQIGFTRAVLFGSYKAGTNGAWGLFVDSSEHPSLYLRTAAGVTSDLSTSSDLNDGNWHHIVGVRDRGKNNTIYVDGVKIRSLPDYALTASYSLPYNDTIGGSENTFANVSIDEVFVFNRTLTEFEVNSLYYGMYDKATGHYALK